MPLGAVDMPLPLPVLLLLLLLASPRLLADSTSPPRKLIAEDDIPVIHPNRLPASLEVLDRTPLGILGDFKPDIVLCKNGDLLVMAATCAGGLSGHDPSDYNASNTSLGYCHDNWPHMALFRSTDSGQSWGKREEVMLDPPHHSGGEETSLTALSDGTLLAMGNGGAAVFRSSVRDRGSVLFRPMTVVLVSDGCFCTYVLRITATVGQWC